MFQLFLVHRCITRIAPRSLSESLRTTETWEQEDLRPEQPFLAVNKFREFSRRSFTFKGSQDWNSLPRYLKAKRSSSAFRASLKCYFKFISVYYAGLSGRPPNA